MIKPLFPVIMYVVVPYCLLLWRSWCTGGGKRIVLFRIHNSVAMQRRRDVQPPNRRTYEIMTNILKNKQTVSSKKTQPEKYAAFCRIKRHKLKYGPIYDPVQSTHVQCLNDGKRILPCEEDIVSIANVYRNKFKGFGARKLFYKIREHYLGIGLSKIQATINNDKRQRKIHLVFENKPKLKPVQSSTVMGTLQIDLVDIKAKFSELRTDKFRYVSVLEDIFTRYNWLRPLKSKEPIGVVEHCYDIFKVYGAPNVIQTDRGREFYGEFKRMCDKLGIEARKSRAHHPESQGKVGVYACLSLSKLMEYPTFSVNPQTASGGLRGPGTHSKLPVRFNIHHISTLLSVFLKNIVLNIPL